MTDKEKEKLLKAFEEVPQNERWANRMLFDKMMNDRISEALWAIFLVLFIILLLKIIS